MTREEAISDWTFRSNHIKKWLDEHGEEPSIRHYVELIDMAIEALKAKTGGDIISRQDAIDAIMGEPTDAHYPSWYADRIKALPSAEQKAVECSGCKCLGSYESDFPCVNCVRITKDYYCGARMTPYKGGDDE